LTKFFIFILIVHCLVSLNSQKQAPMSCKGNINNFSICQQIYLPLLSLAVPVDNEKIGQVGNLMQKSWKVNCIEQCFPVTMQ